MEQGEGSQGNSPESQMSSASEIVSKLPLELQQVVAGFIDRTVRDIVAQQTSPDGDSFKISANPDQLDFYRKRFQELHDSGALNPHDQNSSKKISFTE